MKTIIKYLLLQAIFISVTFAQQEEFEFYVIDSYVSMEKPYTFHLMFYTSDVCKSSIVIAEKYEYKISDDYTDEHKIDIDISKLKFDSLSVPYRLIGMDENGNKHFSELNEFELPEIFVMPENSSSGIFSTVCIGSVFFLTPSAGLSFTNESSNFTLSKELPVISFYNMGYNYPTGYFGVEYTFTIAPNTRDYLHLGYKQIFQPGGLEFISAGISYVTDFKGFNGVSPELSLGLFKIYEAFTIYSRYRYNVTLSDVGENFHEVSIGLYSNFFSFNF